MEFHKSATSASPKNLYPCLATITITPPAPELRSRRLSTGSFGSDDDNALKRVISGGRRKSSFGPVAGGGEDRRPSFAASAGVPEGGKWYWRVQAGVNEGQIILLPLTQPPNPLLTSPPQPLSQAMPAHSHTAANARGSMPGGVQDNSVTGTTQEEGLGEKIKHFFHFGDKKPTTSTPATEQHDSQAVGDNASQATGTTAVDDHVIDQTPQGEMIPSAEANRIGATNLNANAETGWPGTVHGEKLGAVTIDLRSVEKSKVTLGGGKKGEGSWVIVPVHSYFEKFAGSMIEPLGKGQHEIPKSGTIRFDFDKDWIGAKGEAELLHFYITSALDNVSSAPPQASHERHQPQSENFQLGSGQSHTAGTTTAGAPAGAHPNVELGREVAPDSRA